MYSSPSNGVLESKPETKPTETKETSNVGQDKNSFFATLDWQDTSGNGSSQFANNEVTSSDKGLFCLLNKENVNDWTCINWFSAKYICVGCIYAVGRITHAHFS